ncbi:sugar transporter [Pelagovum pacificum]|uniref:Sugar transporter n=1 Tax=Pelagovum pacificum TaxID=2588711 RepID=A0A5C5GAG8_9RHOB|nr:sugar transporter [Pelagovum pacificum]QQA45079.1 sugar transporter [Pelagovum pacificum]TNY30547.1 sugar transporter [Pelagovum pacificum]
MTLIGQDGAAQKDAPKGEAKAAPADTKEAPKDPPKTAAKPDDPKPKPPPTGPEVIEIRPAAGPARMRRRHWGLALVFLLGVLAPLGAAGWYLWGAATNQYASVVGFTVRQENGSPGASQLLGGLAEFAGASGGGSDTDILYEFIQSQNMVTRINERIDLVELYSENWTEDPLFSLWPSAGIEELTNYWSRMTRVTYDQSSGLIELQVLAFDPESAYEIARAILAESQALINELNATAREDTIRYAQNDLEQAMVELRDAREQMTVFRTRTQIPDPEVDLEGRMGVLNNLQQQLAEALIELDLLLGGDAAETDPRVVQARRRIDVIRGRITEERQSFASAEGNVTGEDYPTLMAEYEGLMVDREFAEQNYVTARASLELAQTNAQRQSRYLAVYIEPTEPQRAEYPRRLVLFGLIAFFLVLAWAIMSLIYYSVRDSR